MFTTELNDIKTSYEGGLFTVEVYSGLDGQEWLSDEGNYIRIRMENGRYEIEKHETSPDMYLISGTCEILSNITNVTNAKKWLLSKLSKYDNIVLYDDTKIIGSEYGFEISQTDIELVLIQFELRKIDSFENCDAPCLGC